MAPVSLWGCEVEFNIYNIKLLSKLILDHWKFSQISLLNQESNNDRCPGLYNVSKYISMRDPAVIIFYIH